MSSIVDWIKNFEALHLGVKLRGDSMTGTLNISAPSGIALNVDTTASSNLVIGELIGATGYVGIGFQGALNFANGANPQANLYQSASDNIFYINNRLNGAIAMRINNVDAFQIDGTNRDAKLLASSLYLDQLEYVFFDRTAGAGGDTAGKLGIRGFNAGTNNYLSFESNLGVAMQVGRIGGNQRTIFPSTAGGVVLADNIQALFGTSEDTAIRYSTSQTPDSWQFGVSADSRALMIIEKADVGAFDFAHALQTNPTIFIHSANQSTTEWLSLTHNQTDGVIDCGTGTLNLGGTANVNFAGATRTASTVTHDAYVQLEVAGVLYKFMLGS